MFSQISRKWQWMARFVAVGILVAGCSGVVYAEETKAAQENDQAADEQVVVYPDPYEHFNRDTFAFNDFWDRNLLKPVAKVYRTIMPTPLRQGVTNFFRNLNTLSTIANDILQFNFYQMANDSWRMAINTTVGIGGLFDVASRIGLDYYENDFGMTLAKYGWENSNYLVIPFYGSYTLRDGVSMPVDFFLLSAYQFIDDDLLRYGLYAVGVVNTRADALKYENLLQAAAVDKYAFVRNAYMQHRAEQIRKNQNLSARDQLESKESVSLDDIEDTSLEN